MKTLATVAGLALLIPSLAWAHGGGLDARGCHNDTKKGDYHCHQGALKGRSFKSEDTMLAAHPEMRNGAGPAGDRKAANERAKKEKAEDKVKDGDKTTTDEYAKDAKRKKAATPR